MLQIGLIGTWHVHTQDYVQQLQESGKATIVAVWDECPKEGQAWADRCGAEFIPDYDQFLARKDIVAVVCDSPTTAHPLLLRKAAEAGKHIFTEKLLATSYTECEALAAAIEKSGVCFTISLPLRTNPQVLYIKELVETGKLGRITGARMRRSHSGVSDGWLPERWFDVAKSGGGAMMDLGAHPVYLLSWLLGTPKRISGMLSCPYATSSDENAISLVEFENGVLATCETAFVTYGVPDLLEVYGTEGSVFMHGSKLTVATKETAALGLGEVAVTRLPTAPAMPLAQFLEACISGGPAPIGFGLKDALVMTQIIESTYRSNQTNTTIQL